MGMMKKMITANTVFGTNGTDAGGLSALLIPVKASPLGVGLIMGGISAVGIGNTAIQHRNRAKMGRITYSGGPARMTKSFTSGGVEGMMRASKGNYEVFSDMVSDAMTNNSIGGIIENYGVTPQFVSALYGMGGR